MKKLFLHQSQMDLLNKHPELRKRWEDAGYSFHLMPSMPT